MLSTPDKLLTSPDRRHRHFSRESSALCIRNKMDNNESILDALEGIAKSKTVRTIRRIFSEI